MKTIRCSFEITFSKGGGFNVFDQEGGGRICPESAFREPLRAFLVKVCDELVANGVYRVNACVSVIPGGSKFGRFYIEKLVIELRSGFYSFPRFVPIKVPPELDAVCALIAWYFMPHFEQIEPDIYACVMCRHVHTFILRHNNASHTPPTCCGNSQCDSHAFQERTGHNEVLVRA
jgi:hypothetical protein